MDNKLLNFLKRRKKVVNTLETGYDLVHYVQYAKREGELQHELKRTEKGFIDIQAYERVLTCIQGGKTS